MSRPNAPVIGTVQKGTPADYDPRGRAVPWTRSSRRSGVPHAKAYIDDPDRATGTVGSMT
ncbi:hypothetical protein IPF89_05060 [Candidatus Saccharibacteria bacterium]|nr:MAG: hypothetical protein IPF89_05060 [Candidatus Saccharibacteria bacterium]